MEARRGEVVRSAMFAVRKSGQRTAALQNLAEASCCVARASVLECGCPLPLPLEPLSADRTLQSHPACTVELRFETFGNFAAACEQFRLLQCRAAEPPRNTFAVCEQGCVIRARPLIGSAPNARGRSTLQSQQTSARWAGTF